MSDATIKVSADTREADRALGRLQNSLGALATGAGIAAFARISDAATELSNKLNQVSKSSTQTSMIFSQLVNVANNARTPLGQTGDLFFRIAKSADQLGISQNQALQTTELVAKAISASGISAAEASGPLLQLGQALQSGRLQGDELRSIMEGLPPVARALATSLGVPIGALKELGAQGKISGRQVVDAILQARDSIEKDFGKTTMTIGQAITVLSNNFTVLINKFNESSGASSGIVKAITYVSSAINYLGDNAKTIGYIIDILMFIPILRGIKLLAVGLRGVGAYFTNFSYIVRDGAGAISGFLKYSISQWKSFRTQASGLAQPFVNALDMIIRPLGQFGALLLKISASFLKNFKAPIAAGLMYISGLLDPLINKFKEITGLGGAEVSVDTGGANAKLNSLRARQEQSAKKQWLLQPKYNRNKIKTWRSLSRDCVTPILN